MSKSCKLLLLPLVPHFVPLLKGEANKFASPEKEKLRHGPPNDREIPFATPGCPPLMRGGERPVLRTGRVRGWDRGPESERRGVRAGRTDVRGEGEAEAINFYLLPVLLLLLRRPVSGALALRRGLTSNGGVPAAVRCCVEGGRKGAKRSKKDFSSSYVCSGKAFCRQR